MQEYELCIEAMNPCGGSQYARREILEVETDDPVEYVRQNAMFPILGERRHQQAGTLSGGEQQMLAIGRALMSEPEFIMFDEPSMGLAPVIVKQVFKIIRQINAAGTTVLLIEQNARQALGISDYTYVLENGHIKMEGPSKELLADPAVQKAYLGE